MKDHCSKYYPTANDRFRKSNQPTLMRKTLIMKNAN
jgi:hypothetical protein